MTLPCWRVAAPLNYHSPPPLAIHNPPSPHEKLLYARFGRMAIERIVRLASDAVGRCRLGNATHASVEHCQSCSFVVRDAANTSRAASFSPSVVDILHAHTCSPSSCSTRHYHYFLLPYCYSAIATTSSLTPHESLMQHTTSRPPIDGVLLLLLLLSNLVDFRCFQIDSEAPFEILKGVDC